MLLAAFLAADAGATDGGGAAPDAAAAPESPAACTGADLDLDQIVASKTCDVRGVPHPPPAPEAIGIELTPPKQTVAAGAGGRVTIAFRNLTDAPLPLDVEMSCGLDGEFETEIYAGKKRADLVDDCGIGRGCGRRVVRITLAPRGTARIHAPVSATAEVTKKCVPTGRRRPLAAGKYRLIVNTPLDDRVPGTNQVKRRQVTGELTVRAR